MGGGRVITGAITVDLTGDPDDWMHEGYADRRALEALRNSPDGARVIVNIGSRRYISEDAARGLHEHEHRLSIEIHGHDPLTVSEFVRAARAGTCSGVFA